MDADNYIGCAVAPADSVSKDINDNDDQTDGCAIARAAHPSSSNSEDFSDGDDDSFAKTCYPVGLKSDGGERIQYWLTMLNKKKNHSSTFQEHPIIYFVFLIS
jgi:hypothetical protein